MNLRLPRLLPVTIFAIAALLAMKSVDLVRAAVPQEAAAAAPATPNAVGAQSPPGAHAAPGAHAPPSAPPAAGPAAVPQTTSPTPDGKADVPPISDGERALLLDLRQRRRELEARDTALAAREAVQQATEQKLSARIDELKTLQAKLEALDDARKAHDEANWRGLVKLYEVMKPRDAAAIFNDLDMPVLLQVLDRMKEAKAAPILAAMQPEKSRQVTAALAQMRTRATSDAGASNGG